MSVCLSLCGGACVWVEGCSMHQNMCLLAVPMMQRSQERLSLPLASHLSLLCSCCLSPRFPSFGLWSLHAIAYLCGLGEEITGLYEVALSMQCTGSLHSLSNAGAPDLQFFSQASKEGG